MESANTIVRVQLAKVCEMLGLPRITTHNARHSAALRIKNVVDIHMAKTILGHSTVKQTEDYLNDLDTSAVDQAFADLEKS